MLRSKNYLRQLVYAFLGESTTPKRRRTRQLSPTVDGLEDRVVLSHIGGFHHHHAHHAATVQTSTASTSSSSSTSDSTAVTAAADTARRRRLRAPRSRRPARRYERHPDHRAGLWHDDRRAGRHPRCVPDAGQRRSRAEQLERTFELRGQPGQVVCERHDADG